MNARINIHFGGFNSIAGDWEGTAYYGTNWRLCYTLSSGAYITTRGETIHFEPDHIYLLPPGLDYTAWQQNNPEQLYFHFDAAEPYDTVHCRVYPIKLRGLHKTLLDRTFKELQAPPLFLTDAGMMHALSLIATCLSEIPDDSLKDEGMDSRIEEAIEYLRASVHQSVTVEDVANTCGMSKGSFTRLFKKETGSTPHGYLTELRIRWACELLEGDAVPIERIAEYTGFTDRFHFSRVFKKCIGIPPADYRRRKNSELQSTTHRKQAAS